MGKHFVFVQFTKNIKRHACSTNQGHQMLMTLLRDCLKGTNCDIASNRLFEAFKKGENSKFVQSNND